MRPEKDSIHKQILELVYPELKYGEDPDIERYFELRSQGRMLDALAVYQGKLKPRYPDDAQRIELLALYRRNSPSFPQFLFGLLEERAGIIIRQLKGNIDSLLGPLEGQSLKNTYKVLKAVETIARLLPEANDRALDMLSFYEPVVQILGYRQKEFKVLSRLLSDFYEQTAIKELEAFDFLSLNESALLEQRRREEEFRRHENYFNIDNIEFDESDRQAIEISTTLERNEDKVLAYCYKYWLRIDDAAFERIIFLYSQKNKSRHYDIFRTIKFCRKRKYSDDDILTMVATSLSIEYSYTVQGDIYMQETWRRLKAGLYGVSASGRASARNAPQVQEEEAIEEAPAVKKPKERKAASAPRKPSGLKRINERPSQATSLAKELERRRKLLSKPAKAQKTDIPGLVYTGSISEKVKRIAGRSYDVYQDLFLLKVRTFIQDELQKNRIEGGRGFGDTLSLAEDTVYACIKKNYLNTYFDWMNAQENRKLKEYGFDLASLDGIVEKCMRHIMEKERVV